MADPHELSSPTPFDAQTGDAIAFGLYGDPAARQMHDANAVRAVTDSFEARDGQQLGPRAKLVLAAWGVAIFVISAVVSPYILN